MTRDFLDKKTTVMNIDLETVLKVLALVISLSVLIKGLYEYTMAQKWKKAEFVSKEIKEFNADFDVKRAMMMLDWNANELPLKENEIENKTKFRFTDEMIYSALTTHKTTSGFTFEEAVIKGVFDVFFDRLTMIDIFIETKLIEVKDIKPYLIYWIEIIANSSNARKEKKVRDQIWTYINEYGYTNVKSLCERFGYTVN